MARKKTQAYTEEFRREAVKRAEKEGNTTASVANNKQDSLIKKNTVDFSRRISPLEFFMEC